MWHDGDKPEGVAVELIDGIIRILDFFGQREINCTDPNTGEPSTFESLYDGTVPQDEGLNRVPELVCVLHYGTSSTFCENTDAGLVLLSVISTAAQWIHRQGLDPLALLWEKHTYNRGRPYKHGKKF